MTFVSWRPWKQSALVCFQEESYEKILKKAGNFTVHHNLLQIEMVTKEETDHQHKHNNSADKIIRKKSFSDQFGVFFGKIPRSCKKSEFRQILQHHGVFPDHLNWNGRSGSASAFWKESQSTVLDKLKNLTVKDQKIVIEEFKRNLNNEDTEPPKKVWTTEVQINLPQNLNVNDDIENSVPHEVTESKVDLTEHHNNKATSKITEIQIELQTPVTELKESEQIPGEDIVKEEVTPPVEFKYESIQIPSFCDKIRDIQHVPEDTPICKSYSVQDPVMTPRNRSRKSFAQIAHLEVKRNASVRTPSKSPNSTANRKPSKSPNVKRKSSRKEKKDKVVAVSNQPLIKLLSIDTDETIAALKNTPSTSRKQEEKKSKDKCDVSSKRHRSKSRHSNREESSSDNKSQHSLSSNKLNGAANKDPNHSSHNNVIKQSKTEQTKDSCVLC